MITFSNTCDESWDGRSMSSIKKTYDNNISTTISNVKLKDMNNNVITTREREILRLVAFEYSSKEIAQKLYIADSTVISHRQNMMLKLKVKNTAGLVRRGFESGILDFTSTI